MTVDGHRVSRSRIMKILIALVLLALVAWVATPLVALFCLPLGFLRAE